MKESTALIRLTKSEIEMVINALQLTGYIADHFDIENMFTYKIKHDFIKIREDIIEGENNNETTNKMEKKVRGNQKTCEVCDD